VARFLTVGNLLVEDIVMPDGRELRDRLGGDAIYAALGGRAFAEDVAPVVRLGQGFPPELRRALEAAGYGAGLIASPHPAVRLRVDWGVEGGSRFTFEAGSGTYLEATPLPDELPPKLLEGLEAVHIAPIPFEPMSVWLEWARKRARLVTVDPHYQHLDADWRSVLPHAGAFLPSRAEATELLGGWPGPEEAVRSLAELGCRTVCVKLGGEGAIAIRDGEVARVPALAGHAVDPTGCGDAFCGGFLVGLHETDRLRSALAHGTVAASFAGRDHGAAHALTIARDHARRLLARLGRDDVEMHRQRPEVV
jgi:sugar/nucleoside kinase (ribokinase family)